MASANKIVLSTVRLKCEAFNYNANFFNNILWRCDRKINIPHISSLDSVAQMSTETHNGKIKLFTINLFAMAGCS